MVSLKGIHIRKLVMVAMLALVIPLAVISAFADYFNHRAELHRNIDSELQFAATFAHQLLKEDYHDKIQDQYSVSPDEFHQSVDRYNTLCQKLGMEYLWSLMEYEGKIVFTSSTSPDKQADNNKHAQFFEVHSSPEFYAEVFQTMKIQYQDIIDKWGSIRAVLIPHYDAQGRKYLIGASKKQQSIKDMRAYILKDTLITALIFLIPGILICFWGSSWLTRPIAHLAIAAEQIGKGQYDQIIHVEGAYEVNVVSEQLNIMRVAIQDYVNRIELSLQGLREFEDIVNNSPMIVFSLDIQNDFSTLFISENIATAGYSAADFISGKTTWEQVVPEEALQDLRNAFEETLRKGKSTYTVNQTQLIWASGEVREHKNWYKILKNKAGIPTTLQGMSIDVTESIRAKQQEAIYLEQLNTSLKEMQEFKNNVSNSPVILFRVRIEPGFPTEFITDNIKFMGFTAEDMQEGRITWDQFLTPETMGEIESTMEEALSAGKDTYYLEANMVHANGEKHWYSNWNRIIRNAQGQPTHVQGLLVDITEEKQIAEDLKIAAQDLREFHQIVSSSPILIYRVKLDENLSTEYISENYALMGYDVEKLRSGEIKWSELIPEEDNEIIKKIIEKELKAGSDSYVAEIRMRWANGELHWYQCWNQFIRDDDGATIAIQGIMSDISDLKESQNRDVQYQTRLKALARDLVNVEDHERRRLAYVLHDDIGQMLAALNMKFAVLKEEQEPERVGALVEQVENLMNKIMSTTKSLTWEISPTSLYETDMAAGFEHMAADLQMYFNLKVSILTAGMRVELDRETSAFIFRCSKELLVNVAKHAGVDAAEIGISQYGDKVHLVVSDQGKGFDTDILEQSTRPGFGLFSIKERLDDINGSMSIKSVRDHGTRVMLIIPVDISALI